MKKHEKCIMHFFSYFVSIAELWLGKFTWTKFSITEIYRSHLSNSKNDLNTGYQDEKKCCVFFMLDFWDFLQSYVDCIYYLLVKTTKRKNTIMTQLWLYTKLCAFIFYLKKAVDILRFMAIRKSILCSWPNYAILLKYIFVPKMTSWIRSALFRRSGCNL